ncbi:MAG: hypothetical protein F6K23_20435 [Okeania sp. SIO2C9]|uniref:hypothetical protein n=1 Tax=Okeania sp. SIO2C9 TaxID=2607791 RepID=UPI0013C25F6E|nr:hypothetical protein [Okeania sp. SIO2C9]NEQ75202.1 hypothetical protein [Okeania sp. SIO2C9]
MKRLLEYLDENRKKQLKAQFSQNNSPNYIIDKIQNDIKILRNIRGEYIPELTRSQARIALKGLADIERSLSLMKAAIPPDFPLDSDVEDSIKLPSKKSSKAMITIATLSGGIGGIIGSFVGYLEIQKQVPKISAELIENIRKIADKSPNVLKNGIEEYPDFQKKLSYYPDFQKNLLDLSEYKEQLDKLSDINQINPLMAIAIGFLIGFLIAGIIAFFVYQRDRKQLQPQQKTNLAKPQLNKVKFMEDILDFLHEKFEDIDNQVAKEINELQEKPKPSIPKLEDHEDILNFFQNFFGEVSDEQTHLSQQLLNLLKNNGIDVVFYQPGIEDTSKFDFVKNIDPKVREYIALTPALIKDNEVIRTGRVVKPVSF